MKKALKFLKRAPHYIKVVSKLSSEDIILASFPKSGNTWVRNILANYIGLNDLNKNLITFKELDTLMPGLGTKGYFKSWYYSIPKFSATHLKFYSFFRKSKNVLVVRDPRDVMVSYFYYLNNKNNNYYFENLYELMIHPRLGIENWFKHTKSWIDNIDFVIIYEEMLENDITIIEEIFNKLEISFDKDNLKKAVKNSRFDNFKKIEKTHGHSKPESNLEGFSFARKGKSGDYKNHFDEKCYDLYNQMLSKYGFNSYEHILQLLKK